MKSCDLWPDCRLVVYGGNNKFAVPGLATAPSKVRPVDILLFSPVDGASSEIQGQRLV